MYPENKLDLNHFDYLIKLNKIDLFKYALNCLSIK